MRTDLFVLLVFLATTVVTPAVSSTALLLDCTYIANCDRFGQGQCVPMNADTTAILLQEEGYERVFLHQIVVSEDDDLPEAFVEMHQMTGKYSEPDRLQFLSSEVTIEKAQYWFRKPLNPLEKNVIDVFLIFFDGMRGRGDLATMNKLSCNFPEGF